MHSAVIIGSGFSGICMGIKLKEQGINDFIILEKANELGGTWRENAYPGAECDIPSALYSYSFEHYSDWEYKWSHQKQILEYLRYCSDKYDITDHIRFNKELVSARWQEDRGVWVIQAKDQSKYETKCLITAIGQLHHPSIPHFQNRSEFSGASFHSAQWNHNVLLTGKNIGVIGNAASAIQFIPQIAKDANRITIFQRTANWMLPKQDRLYKNWEKALVRRVPILLKLYRLRLWLIGGGLFFIMKSGNSKLREVYQNKSISYIKKYINDPEKIEKLIPKFPMGAKRILFSDDYYKALSKSNIEIITSPINKFGKAGLQTMDNNRYEFDVLIYATGFKTNPFLLGLDISGKDEILIQEAWKDGPKNYLGITVDGFPNMFMMYGPNTNLGHNSIIIMSEAQANYISQAVKFIVLNKWKSVEVKKSIINTYFNEIQSRLENMIWSKIENSWYTSSTGQIPNNWPGRTMEYSKRTRKVNWSDFVIQK